MDLLESIKIPVSGYQEQRILAIDAEDFTGVKRLVKKDDPFLTEKELDAGIFALKQYYAIALLDGKNEHAVSLPIDPYWHAHILHTVQYVRFCKQVFGQYIHHDPLDHADTEKVGRVRDVYAYTRGMYDTLFVSWDAILFPEAASDADLICPHHPIIEGASLWRQSLFPLNGLALVCADDEPLSLVDAYIQSDVPYSSFF